MEFADWSDITNASLWGRLRDFLIAQFGLDETDKVLPSWQVDSCVKRFTATPGSLNRTSVNTIPTLNKRTAP